MNRRAALAAVAGITAILKSHSSKPEWLELRINHGTLRRHDMIAAELDRRFAACGWDVFTASDGRCIFPVLESPVPQIRFWVRRRIA